METKQLEKQSNSSDIDMFENINDDVVEQILGYLPLKDKILLEGVSKQWQRCIFDRQTIIRVTKILDEDNDSLNKLLKPIVACDFARSYAKKKNYQEIRNEEFEYVLDRCKMIKSVGLKCYIDDSVIELIGSKLNGLETLECAMFGITRNGLIEFGRKYGQKLKNLCLHYADVCEESVLKFLRYCPNITILSRNESSEYIIADKDFLPKLESLSVEVEINSLVKDIENLRIISEKYGKTIEYFDVILRQFDRRALDYVTTSFVNVRDFSLKLDSNSDDNQNIDHYIVKLSENCGQLDSLKIILNCRFAESGLPWSMFYSFEKFSSIETLEISIERTDKLIDCKCECFKLCAKLKHLTLSYTQINEVFFKDIGQHLPNLRSIDLDTEFLFTDYAMESLAKLKKLSYLWLRQCRVANRLITDIGVCQLINACTRIEQIHLSATPRITNTTIDCLKAIAMQRNRNNLEFRCDLSYFRDEQHFHLQIEMNGLINLPKNLKINIQLLAIN